MVGNEAQWFANGSTTYPYHANTDLIMAMCLIWISLYNYFKYVIIDNFN